VQGRVIDGETNTPLPGANVFIANSTYGVSTDVDGAFVIKGLRAAQYRLVISFIGYETQVTDVNPVRPFSYKVILKPSIKTLNEIVIRARKASRSEWLANFKIFKEKFIGLSENARLCTIENPRVLTFENKEGVLNAFADSALIVQNNGLGYRIRILLDKYQYNLITILLHYEGQIVYEPLVPANDEEKITWAKNRLKAHNGSEMQFLRSLYDRKLNDDGYYFNLINDEYTIKGGVVKKGYSDTLKTPRSPVYNNKRIKIQTITDYNRILDTLNSTPEQPVLSFKGDLEITYINEAETYAFQVNRKSTIGKSLQSSTIILHKPAMVQSHGQVYPQDAVETRGYWSWELMAESLPLDYDPALDLKITGEGEKE
jgi:hypothetical protein